MTCLAPREVPLRSVPASPPLNTCRRFQHLTESVSAAVSEPSSHCRAARETLGPYVGSGYSLCPDAGARVVVGVAVRGVGEAGGGGGWGGVVEGGGVDGRGA